MYTDTVKSCKNMYLRTDIFTRKRITSIFSKFNIGPLAGQKGVKDLLAQHGERDLPGQDDVRNIPGENGVRDLPGKEGALLVKSFVSRIEIENFFVRQHTVNKSDHLMQNLKYRSLTNTVP